MRPEELRPRKTVVRWDDDEWDKLADLVFTMRRNTPEDSIAQMATRAQQQFPKHRQRPGTLTTAAVRPLIERIKRKDRDLQLKAEKCDELQAKLAHYGGMPATKQELAATFTDEEVRAYFLGRVMHMVTPEDVLGFFPAPMLMDSVETPDLVAISAKRLVQDLATPRPVHVSFTMPEGHRPLQPARPKASGPSQHGSAKKKVVVVGTKGDQPRHLAERLGPNVDLLCIEVDKLHPNSIPKNADHVVIWSRFASHDHRQIVFSAMEPRRISEHTRGGLTELAEFIESLCELPRGGRKQG